MEESTFVSKKSFAIQEIVSFGRTNFHEGRWKKAEKSFQECLEFLLRNEAKENMKSTIFLCRSYLNDIEKVRNVFEEMPMRENKSNLKEIREKHLQTMRKYTVCLDDVHDVKKNLIEVSGRCRKLVVQGKALTNRSNFVEKKIKEFQDEIESISGKVAEIDLLLMRPRFEDSRNQGTIEKERFEEMRKIIREGEEKEKILRIQIEKKNQEEVLLEIRVEKMKEENFKIQKENQTIQKRWREYEKKVQLKRKEFKLQMKQFQKEKEEMKIKFAINEEKVDKMTSESETFRFERSLVGKTFKSYTQIKPVGGRGLSKKLDGSMSVVYHVKHKGRDLAMKIMLNLDDRCSLTLQSVFLSSEFLDRLPIHPSLLRIHNCFIGTVVKSDLRGWDFDESFVRNKTAFLIMPLCDGNLKTKVELAGNRRPIFNDEKFVSFLKQIVNGLEVMKKHNFIHRDIKQDNLLEKDGKYLICDFGVCFDAKRYRGFKFPFVTPEGRGGSSFYMPPEIRDRDDFGEPDAVLWFDKYDVYSLGIVCFELFSRREFSFGIKLKKEECKNKRIRRIILRMIAPYEKRFSVEELHKKVSEL